MSFRSIALAAVASSAVLGAASAPADAGHRHGFRHHSFHLNLSHRPYRYSYSYDDDQVSCHYYYKKWKHTGRRYWKERYYDCRDDD